jgi:DNA-binding MarR family transcriptional regulator
MSKNAPALRDKTDMASAANDGDVDRGLLADLIGYHLRRADAFTFQSFGAALADDRISPGQLGVLLLVQANPGINQTRAGKALGIDRSTLVSIIDGLEERGLVERTPSPTDRRSHALMLTGAGGTFLADVRPRLEAHEGEVARNLTGAERQNLIRLLEKIVRP